MILFRKNVLTAALFVVSLTALFLSSTIVVNANAMDNDHEDPATMAMMKMFLEDDEETPAAATADDKDLIELHKRLLSETEFEEFHRELWANRWRNWISNSWKSWGKQDENDEDSSGWQGGGQQSSGGQQQQQQQQQQGGGNWQQQGGGGGGWQGGGQHGGGGGTRGGNGGGGLTSAQRGTIQRLLQNRHDISRTVNQIKDNMDGSGKLIGMSTITTSKSNNPSVVQDLQSHVHDMKALLDRGGRVRQWDPLYEELVQNADGIDMQVTDLYNGVSVQETAYDNDDDTSSCIPALIREHAITVTKFISNGQTEVRMAHDVPSECD